MQIYHKPLESDKKRNLYSCPEFSQIVPYSHLTRTQTRNSCSLCHPPPLPQRQVYHTPKLDGNLVVFSGLSRWDSLPPIDQMETKRTFPF